MTAAILGLIAAVAAALISRSVMISNHRQAWINGLRDDLASFFTALDAIHFRMATVSQSADGDKIEGKQAAQRDALLAYRRILMRLNINEAPHQELEQALGSLMNDRDMAPTPNDLTAAVTLARHVLKHEWDVTKYGPFTTVIMPLKKWWRRLQQA